jgi:hypothetical protein
MKGGVQHAVGAKIVDVATIAKSQLTCFVFHTSAAHATDWFGIGDVTLRYGVDRIENLYVSGTATQVGSEVAAHVGTRERRALFVDLTLGPHHDPRDAKSTLQAPAGSERSRIPVPFVIRETLESDDVLAGHFAQRLLATDDGFAVDQNGAATTLSGR